MLFAAQANAAQPGSVPPAQSTDLTGWAGSPRNTSLPELLQVAVRQSPALQNAKIDIAIAEAQIQQTWGRNDWLLQAELTGVQQLGTIGGREDATQLRGTGDLSRVLPTGGTVSLHVETQQDRWDQLEARLVPNIANLTLDTVFVPVSAKSSSARVNIGIVQPLLRGRGSELYDATERVATLSRDAAVLAHRLAAIQTVQTVVSAYWDLVLAERAVAITQASLGLARERLRVTSIGADGGKIPRSEIPAVLQIIATREEEVLSREVGVLEASIALRRASGMQLGAGEIGLRVATDVDTKDEPLDLRALVERSYAASPELAQLAKQDASATIEIEVTENGLLPQLDAALRLGPVGEDRTFPKAWQQVGEFNAFEIAGSLTFSQSLSNDQVRGRVREQREIKRKITVNADDIRAQIAQTMTRAVSQIELARRRVTLSQRAIDLANENIKIETDRFNLGKSTNFDVLNRQEDLRQAELRKIQALIDWHKAEIVVHALTGDVLPMYGISLDEKR